MFESFGVKLAKFFTKSKDESTVIAPQIVPLQSRTMQYANMIKGRCVGGTVGAAGAFGRHLKKHAIPGGVTFSKPPKVAVAG